MNKETSLVVLVAGIVLILYGFGVSNSQGTVSERTIALLCSGAVFAVLGGYGFSRRPSYHSNY